MIKLFQSPYMIGNTPKVTGSTTLTSVKTPDQIITVDSDNYYMSHVSNEKAHELNQTAVRQLQSIYSVFKPHVLREIWSGFQSADLCTHRIVHTGLLLTWKEHNKLFFSMQPDTHTIIQTHTYSHTDNSY